MASVYKIHPGIGLARVGKSENGYFLAPETVGGLPLEVTESGDVAFTSYKDASHVMRRQGARFRIFEYDRNDTTGRETLVREITAAEANIEWTVTLASRKAAGMRMDDKIDAEGASIVVPSSGPSFGYRNNPPSGFSRDDLVASIALTATGRNFVSHSKPLAKFLKKDLYIGEARTDFAGRLIVLGGMGYSATWTNPPSDLIDFLNNPGWHDDIADGPVDAKITIHGSQQALDVLGAWVIVAPPDFAPDITPITTLYDIAIQARMGISIGTVSCSMDIEPVLRRIANYYWVNSAGQNFWDAMRDNLKDPSKLQDNSDANKQYRKEVFEDVVLEAEKLLIDFRMTLRQKAMLNRWMDGAFVPGPDPQRPELNAGEQLDAAALSIAVGGGFYPGIEAGLLLRQPTIYSDLCRLTRGDFIDDEVDGTVRQLEAGSITERMACPWQADFVQCLGAWWPAQRPDVARYSESGSEETKQWDRKVRLGSAGTHLSRKNMVDYFARLGVIEPMTVDGKIVFAEKGRDPTLDAEV